MPTDFGFLASNRFENGEGYVAKFDGKEFPVTGAPAHNMVCLKRLKANTIIETYKLDGRLTTASE